MLKRQPISLKYKTLDLVYRNNQIINKEFKSYYEKLYTSEIIEEDPLPFLKSLNLKSISTEQKEELNKDIICTEIKSTINNVPLKKASIPYAVEIMTDFLFIRL